MKVTFALVASLAALAGSVQAQQVRQPDEFVDILNGCLSARGASFVECAGIAGSLAGTGSISVTHTFDLSDTSEGSSPTEGVEVNCNGSGTTCWVYRCPEGDGNGMQLCTHIADCVEDDKAGQTICW